MVPLSTKAFSTPDISLATALILQGHNFYALEHLKHDKFLFVFNDDQELQALILRYHKQELEAPVQSVLAVVRSLKARLKYAIQEKDKGSRR